jgi:hypothetical protein
MKHPVCLFLFSSVIAAAQGYGDMSGDMPCWQERALLVLTNACRTDPQGYRDTYVGAYSILLPSNHPAVAPLYLDDALNRSARFHAVEMATDCGLTHNSCDGTSFFDRVRGYYKDGTGIAENIATSRAQPQETMKQWIMDGDPPAADKSSQAGHRTNIMSGNYREIGTGYAHGPVRYNHFWVQDFGSAASTFCDRPIAAGSHLFFVKGQIAFMANYTSASGAPSRAAVVIDGTEQAMQLHLGTAASGTYLYSQPQAVSCRQYYFSFTDKNGKSWRHPENGFLMTYGEGTCSSSYTGAAIPIVARPACARPGHSIQVRIWREKSEDHNSEYGIMTDLTGQIITSSKMHRNRYHAAQVYVWFPRKALR